MEFLKINEKLRWHGYSSIKLCNINQNEAKIKFGQKRAKDQNRIISKLCIHGNTISDASVMSEKFN